MITWVLFIPACFALNMAPGPNNMTAFATGAQAGFGRAFLGGMGRMPAFLLLILLTALGLGALLATSATAFTVIKILGAVYLVYVGWRLWTAPVTETSASVVLPLARLMRRDFLIAIGNPKAIAIFTAFFPQFIVTDAAVAPQLLAMGLAFLTLEAVAVAVYAGAGTVLGSVVRTPRVTRLLNKGVGGFLMVSGASLATSRQ